MDQWPGVCCTSVGHGNAAHHRVLTRFRTEVDAVEVGSGWDQVTARIESAPGEGIGGSLCSGGIELGDRETGEIEDMYLRCVVLDLEGDKANLPLVVEPIAAIENPIGD